ncbi:MAG TPA: hypothetical protein PK986_07005 [Spirochaetota bacterium]|nr:hypothetical protein [Spirochaetota bacterium]
MEFITPKAGLCAACPMPHASELSPAIPAIKSGFTVSERKEKKYGKKQQHVFSGPFAARTGSHVERFAMGAGNHLFGFSFIQYFKSSSLIFFINYHLHACIHYARVMRHQSGKFFISQKTFNAGLFQFAHYDIGFE